MSIVDIKPEQCDDELRAKIEKKMAIYCLSWKETLRRLATEATSGLKSN